MRATALSQIGDIREAAIAYLTVITRDGDTQLSVNSHYALADLYEEDGDAETAEFLREQAAVIEGRLDA